MKARIESYSVNLNTGARTDMVIGDGMVTRPEWFPLHKGLNYSDAMLKARRIQRDEAKLRAMGGNGNYSGIALRLAFDGPHGKKWYAVWVKPIA
jgi:hypothetical protein